jgi:hypothetical protein
VVSVRLIVLGLLLAAIGACRRDTVPSEELETEPRAAVAARDFGQPTASPTPRCLRVGSDVPEPRLLKKTNARIPEHLRRAIVETRSITFDAVIDEEGAVIEMRPRQPPSTPPWPEIVKLHEEAFRNWRYAPTTFDDRPARVCVAFTVRVEVK